MASTPAGDAAPCLALCEVLEQEYAEIFGESAASQWGWRLEAAHILDPERLAHRLIDGKDRAARGLRDGELKGLVADLKSLRDAKQWDRVPEALAAGLNAVLPSYGLYDRSASATVSRFAGVRFRSQTLDRIANPSRDAEEIEQRNRLILEDTFFELAKIYDLRLKAIYEKIHRKQPAALCLSGGGIRSATFGLGVVQGLAKNGLLDQFHYLSTVSGGGYLGGWLSAWIGRTSRKRVIEQLSRPTGRLLEPEPTPIWHLRTYSNYLSPRLGFLSADTWTLLGTYVRNLFLNWLVLIPVLVSLVSLPLVILAVLQWGVETGKTDLTRWLTLALGAVGTVCAILAVYYVHANRPEQLGPTEGTGLTEKKRGQTEFLHWCLLPLVVAAVAATTCWAWIVNGVNVGVEMGLRTFVLIGIGIHFAGWAPTVEGPGGGKLVAYLRDLFLELLLIVAAGAAAGAVAWALAGETRGLLTDKELGLALYTWLAAPILLALLLAFHDLYVGLSSGNQVDAAREWSARFNGWVLIVVLGWLACAGLVIMAPIGLEELRARLGAETDRSGLVALLKAAGGVLGTVSGIVTLVLGGGSKTPATGAAKPGPMNLGLKLAAPTFVVFLVVLFAWLGKAVIGLAIHAPLLSALNSANGKAGLTILTVAALFLLGMGAARLIDMNKFSLHSMYRARLIRAYLGASRPAGERDPNPFTGFDDGDNLPIRQLWPASPQPPSGPPPAPAEERAKRPLHIVNVALNLVGGKKLAWQERKAESFTFSALHCGAHNHGYRLTLEEVPGRAAGASAEPRGYAGTYGPSLGTAMTISGAAVSPNMGYHSSPVISFLLALFNVRLGWWLGNPGYAGRKVFSRSSPASSLGLTFDELLGHTDDKHPYVYLSDGGHFENLGLYEMVLRRCHTIVVSDGGCDPKCAFEDLGNAVRKIRIDFGIPIEFSRIEIFPREDGKPAKAGRYCAIAKIGYSQVDKGAEDGTLYYFKPAFYGSEPEDVYNYATTSPSFPHETTGDQFFSESQFESYRALGFHIIERILPEPRPASDPFSESPLAWFAGRVAAYLQTPLPRARAQRPR